MLGECTSFARDIISTKISLPVLKSPTGYDFYEIVLNHSWGNMNKCQLWKKELN